MCARKPFPLVALHKMLMGAPPKLQRFIRPASPSPADLLTDARTRLPTYGRTYPYITSFEGARLIPARVSVPAPAPTGHLPYYVVRVSMTKPFVEGLVSSQRTA